MAYKRVRLAMVGGLLFYSLWGAPGHTRSNREVRLRDDCEPNSFNAVLGPGACIGNGDTTIQEFNAELERNRQVGSWKFNPDDGHIDQGERLVVVNRGGETHTFTRVAAFGGGFVKPLNTASGNPVPAPECAEVLADGSLRPRPQGPNNLFVPAHNSVPGPLVGRGTVRFQCCIHPWMRSRIEVR
jgi:hypothetical protein